VKPNAVTILFAVACWLAGAALPAAAQGTSKNNARSSPAAEVKRLDAKLEEVRESFLRDTNQLIKAYEDVGQFDRAKALLDALLKLDPQNEPIKAKLAQLNKEMLDANEFDFDLDPASSWQPVGAVSRGRTLRIKVEGKYKVRASVEAGPDGAPGNDPAQDLIPSVPFGAVMAVITNPGTGGRPDAGAGNAQQPKPFTVGSSFERPADRDGMLYLKVNVPPGAKCTGGLTARISGAAPAE
jgi:hypothetical protein